MNWKKFSYRKQYFGMTNKNENQITNIRFCVHVFEKVNIINSCAISPDATKNRRQRQRQSVLRLNQAKSKFRDLFVSCLLGQEYQKREHNSRYLNGWPCNSRSYASLHDLASLWLYTVLDIDLNHLFLVWILKFLMSKFLKTNSIYWSFCDMAVNMIQIWSRYK